MNAKVKKVTIDSTNEEQLAFAEAIDFSALFDHIKTYAGIDCTFYQPIIKTYRGKVYVSFKSDDITAQTGPFAFAIKRCYIHSFSNGVGIDGFSDKLKYWVRVNIKYENYDGTFVSMGLLRAWYSDGKWGVSDITGMRRTENILFYPRESVAV